MARRINPLIFRLGTTFIWRCQYSLLNYTSHLRNFLIFKYYLNSKLNILNRLFFTNYFCFLSKTKIYLKPYFFAVSSFKTKKYNYYTRVTGPSTIFKYKGKKLSYQVARLFCISKYLQYIFYKFSLSTGLKSVLKLRIFYSLLYKYVLMFFIRKNQHTQTFAGNAKFRYYLIYQVYYYYFAFWLSIISEYSSSRTFNNTYGRNNRFNRKKIREKVASKIKGKGKKLSFKFPNRYKFTSNKYFKYNKDTLFFSKYLKTFIFNRLFFFKQYLHTLTVKILDYFYFLQYLYSKILLKHYLNKRYRSYVEYSFVNIYHFSKRISNVFYFLPQIIRKSFHLYKVNSSNKRKVLFIFALSLIYHDVETFNVLLSYLLPRNKNQYAVLRLFSFIMEMFRFFHFNFISLIIKISGKFSGKFVNHKPKTKTITSVYGRPGIPFQDLSIICRYAEKQINTKKGIFGVKVWFYLKK